MLYHSPHHGRRISAPTLEALLPLPLLSLPSVPPCWFSSHVFTFSFSLARGRVGVCRFVSSRLLSIERFFIEFYNTRRVILPGLCIEELLSVPLTAGPGSHSQKGPGSTLTTLRGEEERDFPLLFSFLNISSHRPYQVL